MIFSCLLSFYLKKNNNNKKYFYFYCYYVFKFFNLFLIDFSLLPESTEKMDMCNRAYFITLFSDLIRTRYYIRVYRH